MQQLTATAHQALPAGWRLRPVNLEALRQRLQGLTLMGGQLHGGVAELAGQKSAEALAPALKISEAPFRFQQQRLLQWPKPRLKGQLRLWGWALSRNHCCSASMAATRRCQLL